MLVSGRSAIAVEDNLHNSKASLSTDTMAGLAKQGITLVNVDYRGKTLSLVGEMGEGARAHALAQMLASQDPQTRIKIGRLLISEKIREQYSTLEETLGIREPHLKRTLGVIKRATDLEELLQIEGRAASAYFRLFKEVKIRWVKTNRFPVPNSCYETGSRAALSLNKNARHPATAMLNYAYRVLESDTLLVATSLGLDPYIGFLHADKQGRASLVYDVMEPLGPMVDRKLTELIHSRSFTAGDFFLHPSDVVRLNPKLEGT